MSQCCFLFHFYSLVTSVTILLVDSHLSVCQHLTATVSKIWKQKRYIEWLRLSVCKIVSIFAHRGWRQLVCLPDLFTDYCDVNSYLIKQRSRYFIKQVKSCGLLGFERSHFSTSYIFRSFPEMISTLLLLRYFSHLTQESIISS